MPKSYIMSSSTCSLQLLQENTKDKAGTEASQQCRTLGRTNGTSSKAMIPGIHGMCRRRHTGMMPWKGVSKSAERVSHLLGCKRSSKSLERNIWILDGGGDACFAWWGRERLLVKPAAINEATQTSAEVMLPTDDNHAQQSCLKSPIRHQAVKTQKSAITLGGPSSPTQGNNLLSLVEVNQFHRQSAGLSTSSSLYTSRLSLGGTNNGWRSCVWVVMLQPYACISSHYNEDQTVNSEQIRGACRSSVGTNSLRIPSDCPCIFRGKPRQVVSFVESALYWIHREAEFRGFRGRPKHSSISSQPHIPSHSM